MAHEIGHLLLPAEDDSPGGVMRGVERPEEWQLAVIGRLKFTPQQAAALRSEVRSRSETVLAKSGKRDERRVLKAARTSNRVAARRGK